MDGLSAVDLAGLYSAVGGSQTAADVQISVLGKALEAAETSMAVLLEGLGETVDVRA